MTTTTVALPRVAEDSSFEEFVAARSASLLRTARLLTQDPALAEDLVQTVLGKCWVAWPRIRRDNPGPYVRRVLINTYTAWWRRRWTGELPTDPTDPTDPADRMPQLGYDAQEHVVDDRTDLRQALRRLPKRQRAVVVLRFYEDLSAEETARLLGCSIGTVKSQTSKALAKLRIDPSLTSDRKSP